MTLIPPGLLPAEQSSVDTVFRPLSRRHCLIEPLIDGKAVALRLEEAILAAKETVWITMWTLDQWMKIRSVAAQRARLRDWGDLLVHTAKRGVRLRLMLTDADPVADWERHRSNWQVHRELHRKAAKASVTPDLFQVFCSLPTARLSAASLAGLIDESLAKDIVDGLIDSGLNEIVDDLNSLPTAVAIKSFGDSPGLWQWVEFDRSSGFNRKTPGPAELAPVVHHAKMVIVDGELAILGGSNIGSAFRDDQRHRIKPLGVHDINLAISGEVVGDLKRVFIGLWNLFGQPAQDAMVGFGVHRSPGIPGLLKSTFSAIAKGAPGTSAARPGVSVAQVLRTFTGSITNPAKGSGIVPEPQAIRLDTEQSMQAAIEGASDFIYVENQYFRWPPTGEWLKKALAGNPALTVIVVIPVLPEEKEDPLTAHGIARERELIEDLLAAAPDRVGFYTLEAPVPAPRRGVTTFGGREVYVHSKTLIVDDRFALIGSANINGRGFRVDTEVGIGWLDVHGVRKFRLQLWHHLLGAEAAKVLSGSPPAPPSDFHLIWELAAWTNASMPPSRRKGFVVPRLVGPAPGPNPLLEVMKGPPDKSLKGILRRKIAEDTFEKLKPFLDAYASSLGEPMGLPEFEPGLDPGEISLT